MINKIVDKAKEAIAKANTLKQLDDIRVSFLGKKGEITNFLKSLQSVAKEERPQIGKAVNIAKKDIQTALVNSKNYLESIEFKKSFLSDGVDVSLPSRNVELGGQHPITNTLNRIQSLFERIGFDIAMGPEIENEFYNFTALNIPRHHPARAMHDTFYVDDNIVLRTHTSPVQIRTMQKQKPPVQIISFGKVYRCDSDITHSPMFHQVEALVVNETINFAKLKGLLIDFLRAYFEKNNLQVRFRASYFPFTEPSAEVDIKCVICSGSGCRICKKTGWLEILGCGVVHPNVLKTVDVDTEKYTGIAFGLGIERLAMLYYGVTDLRLFFENDINFLRQFKL